MRPIVSRGRSHAVTQGEGPVAGSGAEVIVSSQSKRGGPQTIGEQTLPESATTFNRSLSLGVP